MDQHPERQAGTAPGPPECRVRPGSGKRAEKYRAPIVIVAALHERLLSERRAVGSGGLVRDDQDLSERASESLEGAGGIPGFFRRPQATMRSGFRGCERDSRMRELGAAGRSVRLAAWR